MSTGELVNTLFLVRIPVRHLSSPSELRIGPFVYLSVADAWVGKFYEHVDAHSRVLNHFGVWIRDVEVADVTFRGARVVSYHMNPRTLEGTPLSAIQRILADLRAHRANTYRK